MANIVIWLTEAWFILDAKVNAKQIYKAANSRCQREQFAGDGRILFVA